MTSVAQRLRQKLLDLAIHGKLVPQDPKEETAGELLAWIRKARSATGMARTPAAPLSIPEEEIPFDLPRGWVWCRLGDVAEIQLGKMLDAEKNKGKPFRYLANVSVRWGSFDVGNLKTTLFTDDEIEKFALKQGDLLMCEGGVPGRCAVWREHDSEIKYQKALHRIRPCEVLSDYLQIYFEAIYQRPFFTERFTGSTIHHLPREVLMSVPVPLPPLAEQKRIVEKLNAMMKESRRIAEGMERLTQLRKKARAKILDLAIRGKLVKQEKSDEPATELLNRISAEKARLVAEKKIKKEKPLPPIIDDDKPFGLPSGWAWCRLGDIAEIQLGKMLDAEKNTGKPFRYLANVSVRWGSFDVDNLKTTLFTDDEIEKFALKQGDLLMCEGGVPGRCAVWREHDSEIKYQKALHRIRPCEVLPDYLQIYFEAIYQRPFFTERFTGSTIHHLPREVLMSVPVPLPPLAEQQRIVAKVKEMLAACDVFGGEG